MKKILFTLLFLPLLSFSQVASPPTLIAGLSGLSGEKGDLDIALISEIVTEKQAELKKELVTRLIFDRLRVQNYTTWEFAYNTLNILLDSQSKGGIQKEVLEYASNAAFVYGFAEVYLQISARYCNGALFNLVNTWDPSNSYNPFFNCPASTLGNVLPSQLILPRLNRTTGTSSLPPMLSNLLIDMVYDILKQNQTIKSLGFFKSALPLGDTFYQNTSAYYSYRTQPQVSTLYNRMQAEINGLVNNYYLIKVIVDDSPSFGSIPSYLSRTPPTIPSVTATLAMDLQNLNSRISSSPTKDPALSKRITEVYSAFSSFVNRSASGSSYTINDLYFLDQKILPLIVELTTEYGFDPKYLSFANTYRQIIVTNLFTSSGLSLYTGSPSLGQIASEFINLLDNFHKLDKSSSYEFVLSELKDHSKLFEASNPAAHVIFNGLVNFLDNYTTFDKEKNTINMDVEEIISQVYGQYAAHTTSAIQIYFSVGLNQTLNTSNLSGEEGGNIGFAAEKLGFKITPQRWNIKKRRADRFANYFGPRAGTVDYINKSPFISDFHFITYASGLLYNIVNVKTEKDFNRPLFGIGFGPSFFNGLDFHIFSNWTIPNAGHSLTWDKPIVGLSFDIKIIEYLTRLKSKKNASASNK
jgi:hypothetical protein